MRRRALELASPLPHQDPRERAIGPARYHRRVNATSAGPRGHARLGARAASQPGSTCVRPEVLGQQHQARTESPPKTHVQVVGRR
jgi:hypothetical protein